MSDNQVDPQTQVAFRAAKLLGDLVAHPTHGAAAKRMIKELNPSANFPEVEAEDRFGKVVDEKTQKVLDRLEAFEAKQAERDKAAEDSRVEADFTKRLDAVRSKYRFNDVDKVIERMKAQNSPDVEAAAAWVNENTAKPDPVAGPSYMPQDVDLYGSKSRDEKWRSLHENPQNWFDQQVREIMADEGLR